nr:hypothetical protein [Pseudomonas sp. B14(2022)]
MPKGEYGLFVKSADPTSHYLIETNPQFASLSGFLSSDYMLGKLGFSADTAWRRLGDGQYETRLIRDAVLAQTGQRFLTSALSSDADQFRYLMDNALASKDALRLSLGVSPHQPASRRPDPRHRVAGKRHRRRPTSAGAGAVPRPGQQPPGTQRRVDFRH